MSTFFASLGATSFTSRWTWGTLFCTRNCSTIRASSITWSYRHQFCTSFHKAYASPSNSTLFRPISLAKIIVHKAVTNSVTNWVSSFGDRKVTSTSPIESHTITYICPYSYYICLPQHSNWSWQFPHKKPSNNS